MIRIVCILIAVTAIIGSRMGMIEPMLKRILILLEAGGMGSLTTYQKIQRKEKPQKTIINLIIFIGLVTLLLI